MGKVRWTEEAARWLKEVHDYIAEDNPDRIAYLVKEGGDVDILGIFHGALDIQRYLP